jgi:hypothetical protein
MGQTCLIEPLSQGDGKRILDRYLNMFVPCVLRRLWLTKTFP